MGTEWRSIVEVSPHVPVAVPSMLFDVAPQRGRLALTPFGRGHVAALAGKCTELSEHFIKKESQPNAFALPVHAHQVHAVIPISRAHQWQTMLSKMQPSKHRQHTMIVKATEFLRRPGKIVVRILVGLKLTAFDEMDGLV